MKHIDSGEQILECYLAEASSRHPWKFHFSLMKSDFCLPQFRQFFGMWVGKLMWWIDWPSKVDSLDPFLRPFVIYIFYVVSGKRLISICHFTVCQFFSLHFVVLVLSFILNKAGSWKRKKKNKERKKYEAVYRQCECNNSNVCLFKQRREKKRKMITFENQITWPPKGSQGIDLSVQTNE